MHLPDLLPALIAQPDDDTAWLVYADSLEEGGHPHRAEWVRRAVALGSGRLPAPEVEATVRRFKKLRPHIDPGWAAALWALRARRPMRFRILEVSLIGNSPPVEMFERVLTLVHGVLEAGTIRVGQEVLVPRAAGGTQ